jgi:hypothetical protein
MGTLSPCFCSQGEVCKYVLYFELAINTWYLCNRVIHQYLLCVFMHRNALNFDLGRIKPSKPRSDMHLDVVI